MASVEHRGTDAYFGVAEDEPGRDPAPKDLLITTTSRRSARSSSPREGPASAPTLLRERTVDISTTGRRSGRPRRIEIWFYRFEGKIYLSGVPGPRGWFSNLQADPRLTFHLKNGVVADLPARGVVITDPDQRRRIFTAFVADLNQPHNPGRIQQPTHVEDWMTGSPLVEVIFASDPAQ